MTAWWFALAWAGAPMSAAWTTTLPAAPSGDGVELLRNRRIVGIGRADQHQPRGVRLGIDA